MAFSCNSKVDFKATFFVAFILMSACLLPAKADIQAVNNCPYDLTVFFRSENVAQNQITLASGTSFQLGLPAQFTAGVIWGSRTGNPNNAQATQLEFNIAPSDNPTRDFYDISLVNAFNEAAMISPTSLANGDVSNGLECGTIVCIIPDLCSVCQDGNIHAGPDNACINVDGPGLVDTPSIDLFRNACPNVFVQSNDNTNTVFACNTGSDYDAIWCPSN